jgi:hypothetical protein
MGHVFEEIHHPNTHKKSHFAVVQESTRKNVERALGVLQIRFAIVCGPSEMANNDMLHHLA